MDRNILFLCSGNSARSQMGEAILKKHAGEQFKVFSAGTEPKSEIHPLTLKVMTEAGYDLSSQYPKDIHQFLGKLHFEKVIIVCSHADENCPAIFGAAQRLSGPFDDPAAAKGSEEEQLKSFRQVRDEIEAKIVTWIKNNFK